MRTQVNMLENLWDWGLEEYPNMLIGFSVLLNMPKVLMFEGPTCINLDPHLLNIKIPF